MKENFFEDETVQKTLSNANVLVIGSGGIGCELLKSLVVSGFKNISLIDLDTIEKSNLNRQFLFSKNDIGKYKSLTAKENILKMRPDQGLNIEAFVGNIKDTVNYGSDFFSKFTIVLNALDNIDARTHVNRMCHLLNIPLVNSGSEGFLGNVQTSIKGKTPCYNCFAKNNTKAIPICTLRSKPEKIEHCVAWAKNLFEILYTSSENSSFLLDEKLSPDSVENLNKFFFKNLVEEKKMNEKIIPVDLDSIHKSYNPPQSYEEFCENIHHKDSEILGLEFYVFLLLNSDRILQKNITEKEKFEKFDKENTDAVNFVFAASNLRAHSFSIPHQNRFKIKEIAGNIVPAIASTNAIVASLQTIEAIKVLTNNINLLKNIHYNKTKEIKSSTSINESKSSDCIVCSRKENCIFLKINLKMNNLKFFVIEICKKQLKVKSPILWIDKDVLYDENEINEDDDDENESLLFKTLDKWIQNNSIVKICDENSEKVYKIILRNFDKFGENFYEIEFQNEELKEEEKITEKIEDEEKIEEKENKTKDNFENSGLIYIIEDSAEISHSDVNLVSDDENISLGKKRKHEKDIEEVLEKNGKV